MRTGIANILNNTVELDPLDIAVEAALVQDEFRDRFNSITVILNAYDNLVELKRLSKLYPSSTDTLDDVAGTSVESISLEAAGSEVWNKIKQFFEWVWNGIKKLFGVSEKRIQVTVETIHKKRSKSKGDNIGKTITVSIVSNEGFNSALLKIQDMIGKLKKSIPNDSITSMNKVDGIHGSNEFDAAVSAIQEDFKKVEKLKFTRWSQTDTVINRIKEYSNKLKNAAGELANLSKEIHNKRDFSKQHKTTLKYATLYTHKVKAALAAINGCETLISKSIEPLAHDTDSGINQNDVASASKTEK